MNEYIEVGEIVKAHGINGELKIKKLSSEPGRFKRLKLVYIDEKPFKITSLREADDFVYMRFLGYDDRNSVEALKNKFICIDRVNAIPLEEGEFFVADLIGCKIADENNEELGNVTDILSYGAADVIEARGDRGVFRFPFIKQVISEIDVSANIFRIKRDEFERIAVYED